MAETPYLFEERKAKLEELRRLGVDAYPQRFALTHTVTQAVEAFGRMDAEELARGGDTLRVPGRITALRRHGKAAFADLSDGRWAEGGEARSRIQIYVKQGVASERAGQIFSHCDLGDIIGAEGTLFRTRTGELTIQVRELEFLCKSLHPLPEKWHGLSDIETRFRQRYLDLIANPKVRWIFEARSRLVQAMRDFLDARAFLEVETPMMHPIAGGALARPFKTWHEALDMELFLRIAPELYLKRLVVGGFERVYEINRNFRNEGLSHIHNPEFTMLELYQAYIDFEALMPLTEELVASSVQAALGSMETEFKGQKISFAPPWKRLRLTEALAAHVKGFDNGAVGNEESLRKLAARNHVDVSPEASGPWDLLDELVKHCVEPHLQQPTFLTHIPRAMSPLAKAEHADSLWAARFEAFAGGMEIANGFSEQNDPSEQLRAFRQQAEMNPAAVVDEDYVTALEHAMPPAAGLGVGVDRVTMIATGQESIREVIFFPLLRPRRPQAQGAEPEIGSPS